MSYDIYFCAEKERRGVSEREFAEYFSKRRHYRIEDKAAHYRNEDTGVAFTFYYFVEAEESESGEVMSAGGFRSAGVSFNVNFFRPHVFALEAAPEITSLKDHFRLSVFDPQMDHDGPTQFREDDFVTAWNRGNLLSYKSFGIVSSQKERNASPTGNTLESSEIERCWRWNLNRERFQKALSAGAFVPKILFLRRGERVVSSVLWVDGLSTAIPKVDCVVLCLAVLAPRRLFWKRPVYKMVDYSEIGEMLAMGERVGADVPCHILGSDGGSKAFDHLFRTLSPLKGMPTIIPSDSVLDKETLDEAMRTE